MNVELEIKDMDFDGLLAALASNKADMVIAGMTQLKIENKTQTFQKYIIQQLTV